MNEAARVRWDQRRQEPVSGTGREASDPLAELARLVGQDDPYRNVFRGAATLPEQDWREDEAATHDGHGLSHGQSVHAGLGDEWHAAAEPAQDGEVAAGPEDWGGDDDPYHPEQGHADDDRYYAAEAAAHRDDAGIADSGAAAEGSAAAIPDLWARGGAAGHGAAPEIGPASDSAGGRMRESGAARRPLLVLAAVLVLTGGGLGASFLAKGGSGGTVVAANGTKAPTILAATGPTKVKQEDPSATAPEDKDAALLNKNTGSAPGAAKVVQSEEQPTDLGQLPRANDGAAPAAAASPFPEAKKVRTFVVHPDGTPIYDDGQTATASAAPMPAAPSVVAGATPKAAGSGVATPPSPTIASLAADPASPADVAAAPAATPAAPKHDKAKPVGGVKTGTFGLQLAASPSEADANAAFAKLKKKYPGELGSLSANVHQSDTGGKPVYRVRVGGMSREEASALCSKLMAGGGSCFVVHD